jgi:hypothetical protein
MKSIFNSISILLYFLSILSIILINSCDSSTSIQEQNNQFIYPETIYRNELITLKLYKVDFEKYSDSVQFSSSSNKKIKRLSFKVIFDKDTLNVTYLNYDSNNQIRVNFPDTVAFQVTTPFRFTSNKIKLILSNSNFSQTFESANIKLMPEAVSLKNAIFNLSNIVSG